MKHTIRTAQACHADLDLSFAGGRYRDRTLFLYMVNLNVLLARDILMRLTMRVSAAPWQTAAIIEALPFPFKCAAEAVVISFVWVAGHD